MDKIKMILLLVFCATLITAFGFTTYVLNISNFPLLESIMLSFIMFLALVSVKISSLMKEKKGE